MSHWLLGVFPPLLTRILAVTLALTPLFGKAKSVFTSEDATVSVTEPAVAPLIAQKAFTSYL